MVPKKKLSALAILAAMAVLVLDAKTAAAAAAEGIGLCLKTVIPSLFPFFVISRLFLASPASSALVRLSQPVMGPLFGLPAAGAPAVVMGLVGGYPVGARTAAQLCADGRISREEGERLLTFCSNAGPAFLFGMVGGILGAGKAAAIYCIHILSALLTGALLARRGNTLQKTAAVADPVPVTIPQAVSGALQSMGQVCAYVVLFSVLSGFLVKWLPSTLPQWLSLALTGLLEMSGGCCRLGQISQGWGQFLLAALFPTFGGLCVWLQTQAVIAPAGLTGRRYLPGKLLQSAIALALAALTLGLFPGLQPAAAMDPVPTNHQGLMASVGVVSGVCTVLFGIWCMALEKKAGKGPSYEV